MALPLRGDDTPLPPAAVGNNWLVLIAVDQYLFHDFLPDMASCREGSIQLRDLLFERFGFGPPHTIELYDYGATEEAISRELVGLASKLRPEDSLLISFAGRAEGGSWYPADARARPDGIQNFILRNWLREIAARHILILCDSPFSSLASAEPSFGEDASLPSRLAIHGREEPEADHSPAEGDRPVLVHEIRERLPQLAAANKPFGVQALLAALRSGTACSVLRDAGDRGGQFLFDPVDFSMFEKNGTPSEERYQTFQALKEQQRQSREQAVLRQSAEETERHAAVVAAAEQRVRELKNDITSTPAEKRAAWERYLEDFGHTGVNLDYARERVAFWREQERQENISRLSTPLSPLRPVLPRKPHPPQESQLESINIPPTRRRVLPWMMAFAGGGLLIASLAGALLYWEGWLTIDRANRRKVDSPKEDPRLAGLQMLKEVIDDAPITPPEEQSTPTELDYGYAFEVSDEGPERNTVTLKLRGGTVLRFLPGEEQRFWLLRTEVTQRQWNSLMENNPSVRKGDNLPVENLSWDEATEFCKTLKSRFGLPARLPYVDEWESGAKRPPRRAPEELGWFEPNSGGVTHDVATREPNAYGLHDMEGNVWEWCQDSESPGKRSVRGGAYDTRPAIGEDISRQEFPQDTRSPNIGFRIVITGIRR